MIRIRAWIQKRAVELTSLLVATIPLLLSSPGKVGADTKSYLYLDPQRLLGDASSLWDSDVALGTVTHQNVGYLWPMGPYYWLMDAIGSPDWVAQRLWIAAVLFAAGMGVRYLLTVLHWQGAGLLVAVLAYQLSPYLLDYSARISALLLPWAGLPWMVALTICAVRDQGWRYPARFALVVLTIGSVNASSLLFVGLGPALWLIHVTLIERSMAFGRAVAAAARIVSLTVLISLWWIAGLVLQGRFSLPVTRYTETYEVVADASTAPEILRGLGYWFFYGKDKFGAWIQPSVYFTQSVGLLLLTFGLVVLALIGATLVRWRHRSFFLLLFVVGALVGIGAHPFDGPSLAGQWFETFTRSDAGLAMRSTPRAVPLLILATAVFLGCLVNAVQRMWPRSGRVLVAATLAAVILANPAMWAARMIENQLQRDEELPSYWLEAIADLDADDDGTRIWEVPGTDFSSYRWGNTVDPITPGLTDRGYVARELVPFGSPESANLLVAFDRKLQEWTLPSTALVPIAELMSVGDVVHRADLTYERFRTPRPGPTEAWLDSIASLGAPTTYGERGVNVAGPEQVLRDEVALSIEDEAAWPISVYPVPDPLNVVRLRSGTNATVLVGDGAGLVDAAAAGVVDVSRTIFFGADLVTDQSLWDEIVPTMGELIITDSNRRRAQRWGGLRETVGYTELSGQEPLIFDPQDNRLPVFPAAETTSGLDVDDVRTVAVHDGEVDITASRYGNRVTYTIDDRPALAFDGNLETAWSVGAFSEARDEYLRFSYDREQTFDSLTVVQPQEDANRHIVDIEVVSDRGERRQLTLSDASLTPAGERLVFAPMTGHVFDVVIVDLDTPKWDDYPVGVSAVGFAEAQLGDTAPITEWIRTPRAFTDRWDATDDVPLTVVLTRERVNPQEPVRSSSERQMRRIVPISTDATFTVEGSLRMAFAQLPEHIDQFLGRNDTGLRATSSGALAGNLQAVPSAALDGDPTTAFVGRFNNQRGQYWQLASVQPFTVNGITVDVVIDGQHSIPTAFDVAVDGETVGSYPTGLNETTSGNNGIATVTLPVTAESAQTVRLTVADSHDVMTQDWYSSAFIAMPWALSEVQVGDMAPAALTDRAEITADCLGGLLTIDGHDVPIRINGTAEAARNGDAVPFASCGTVDVVAGNLRLETAAATDLRPVTIDQIVLRTGEPATTIDRAPALAATWQDATRATVEVPETPEGMWLVLGQSHNAGWTARLDGVDLGQPKLIDGFANGWLLPSSGGTIVLEWTPQRWVDRALLFSLLFAVLMVVVATRRRPKRWVPATAAPPELMGWPEPASHRPALPVLVTMFAVVAGFALVNLPEMLVLALPLAAIWLLSTRGTHWARLQPALAAVLYGICSLLIAGEQYFAAHPADFIWPQHFDDFHILGVLTVLLVAGEYVRVAVLGRRNRFD